MLDEGARVRCIRRIASAWISLVAVAAAAPVCRAQDDLVQDLLHETRGAREGTKWIEDNVIMKILEPYIDAKDWSRENLNLDFGFQYTTIYQGATGSRDPDDVAIGELQVFGQWHLLDSPSLGKGNVGFLMEYRHHITDATVRQFSDAVGTDFETNALGFGTKDRFAVRQLWWEHRLADDQLVVTIGKLNARAYYNRNAYAGSARTQFLSEPFSKKHAPLFPGDGLGWNIRIAPGDLFYVTAGFQDANADTRTTGFSTFGKGDFFSAIEVGLTPTIAGAGQGNYRALFWHTDETEDHDNGAGFALSFDQELGESLGAFLRYGTSDAVLPSVEHTLAGGLVVRQPFGMTGDLLGVGFSWDRPGSSIGSEYAFEVFYRAQLTTHLEVSPSLMLAIDPVNSDEDVVAVFGIRARVLW